MAKTTVVDIAPLVAEFIGTFVLVFTLGCNQLSGKAGNPTFAATSVACVLMVMVYSFGRISGGHFNPAVSLAVALSGKMSVDSDAKSSSTDELFGVGVLRGPRHFLIGSDSSRGAKVLSKLLSYVLVQVAGGICAGFCYCGLFGEELGLKPETGRPWWQAAVCEVVYTAMLCFVVLNTATAKNNTPNHFYGLAIGFVIVAAGYSCGSISGAALNPAVSLGVDISSVADGFWWCMPYCLFQVLGAIIASSLFRLVRPEDFISSPDNGAQQEVKSPMSAKLASEFIGTFVLVLTVGLNILTDSKATAWSAAAALMCMIYALGDVSGGHFNPAVTCAVAITDRRRWKVAEALAYMVTQILAGILAGFLFAGLHDGKTFPLAPKAPYTSEAAHILEFIFTFVLVFVVLSTAVVKGISSSLPRNFYFALAIGSCVTAGGVASGNVSGGELNPAVSFGIAIVHSLQEGGSLFTMLSFSLVQLAGGITASAIFAVTHEGQK